MTPPRWPVRLAPTLIAFAASPRVTAALTTAAIGVAASTFLVRRLIGWPGLVAILVTLGLLMAASFAARRREIAWRGVLPLSLLGFLGWAVLSLIWSEYQWATLGGLAYLGAFTLLALYIALSRDTIQIVRATGDVLRVMLAASLILEVFSGILIDAPIRFLAIDGRIAELGPITGIASTRNQLGLLAIIGAVTFVIEWRTRSVTPLVGGLSSAAALLTMGLTASPIIYVAAAIVLLAAAAVYLVRRVRPERRPAWQLSVLGAGAVLAVVAWLSRSWVVDLLYASGEINYRLTVWRQVSALSNINPLEGWGWIGRWDRELVPFIAITTPTAHDPLSASNAFVDVWFQLGLVGLAIFTGLVGLAAARSWLLAGRRRSVVYAWPATVLVTLIVLSAAESTVLVDFGWLIFVVCCMKASQELSWRTALSSAPTAQP